MLQLGVAGVSQRFSTYREALRRLRNPVEIDAVYDSVFARAEAVANREEAALESGLRGLAKRYSVDAVILLDAGWHGLPCLHLLASCCKPVFAAPWLSGSAADFERLYAAATTHGVTLMPALWRRYLPAAVRIQELMATEIGAVSEVSIDLRIDSTMQCSNLIENLVGWLDFSRNLFRTFPHHSRLEASPTHLAGPDPAAGALNLIVDYPAMSTDAPVSGDQATKPRRSTIRLTTPDDRCDLCAELAAALDAPRQSDPSSEFDGGLQLPLIRVSCQHGWAEVRSASEVAWQIGDQPAESEKLTADRSEHDILLDLFCRRVAGGLVPVPDYHDVGHAMRVIEEAVSGSPECGMRNAQSPDGRSGG